MFEIETTSFLLSCMGECVTNRQASIFKKAKKDTLTSALFRDPLGARTQDPNIKSVVLYQLS